MLPVYVPVQGEMPFEPVKDDEDDVWDEGVDDHLDEHHSLLSTSRGDSSSSTSKRNHRDSSHLRDLRRATSRGAWCGALMFVSLFLLAAHLLHLTSRHHHPTTTRLMQHHYGQLSTADDSGEH